MSRPTDIVGFLTHYLTCWDGDPNNPALRVAVQNFVFKNEIDPTFTCDDAEIEGRTFTELINDGLTYYLRYINGHQD